MSEGVSKSRLLEEGTMLVGPSNPHLGIPRRSCRLGRQDCCIRFYKQKCFQVEERVTALAGMKLPLTESAVVEKGTKQESGKVQSFSFRKAS